MAKTIIHKDLDSYFGEDFHLEVSQNRSFTSLIFELLSERKPSSEEEKLFDLILNLSIDHGPDTPSAVILIEAAKTGKTLSESLAEGILQINDHHGGAVEPLMELIYRVKSQKSSVKEIVEERIKAGKKMPGFGHRVYKEQDPRTKLIYEKLNEVSLGKDYIQIVQDIQSELNAQTGKNLPINIDGSIATVLCTFEFKTKLGNCVFIIARIPGLCGQYLNNSN